MARAYLSLLAALVLAAGCATGSTLDEDEDGSAGGGTGATGAGGDGGGCDGPPPVAVASNDGPACGGDAVQLTAQTVAGATYAWTGPSSFSSTEQNPTIGALGPEDLGTYTLVVTVDGCESAPATTEIVGPTDQVALSQSSTADFEANTNMAVDTDGDQVTLGSVLDLGTGSDGAYAPTSNTTLAGGTYNFTTVTIPAGVTVTVTGNQPLVIRATGNVSIQGVIEASGDPGGNGVTFSTFGGGGLGRAGGGTGGNGSFASGSGPLPGAAGFGNGPGGAGGGWSGGGGAGHAAAGASSGGSGGAGGPSYGTLDLVMLTAGSGGGGGSGGYNCGGGGGGGGGGAIWITAPDINVGIVGAIRANGGAGGSDGTGNCGGGGGGSGGAIRLSANAIDLDGPLSALGGAGGASAIPGSPYFGVGGAGSPGRIRLDYGMLTGVGAVNPAPGFQGGATASLGTTVTDLLAPAGLCAWGTLTFTATEPPGTSVVVDVLDEAGAILASSVASGTDLSILLGDVPAVRLRASLTTMGSQTPALSDWSLSYAGL